MLVDPGREAEHAMVGTIGGGCGEADVIAAAHDVVNSGRPRMVHVELMDSIEGWSPAVCGGTMDVLVEPILPPADT
jgi:xanthine dehydrogenase accessory factor